MISYQRQSRELPRVEESPESRGTHSSSSNPHLEKTGSLPRRRLFYAVGTEDLDNVSTVARPPTPLPRSDSLEVPDLTRPMSSPPRMQYREYQPPEVLPTPKWEPKG